MLPSAPHASTEQTATLHPDLALYAPRSLPTREWNQRLKVLAG